MTPNTAQHTAQPEIVPPPGSDTAIPPYQLARDDRSWAIQKPRTRKGCTVWESVAWFPTLEMAAQSMLDRVLLSGSNDRTVEQLIEDVRDARDAVIQAVLAVTE